MRRKVRRTLVVIGLVALAGALGSGGALRAVQMPSQGIKSGFESTDSLLKDVERAEDAPLYSAWIVESSRFMNVPHRPFTPDVGEPPFVNLPVNVGIIKGLDGKLTLYDSGWKQLAYIFDWNTSCCWQDLRIQMSLIGLDPRDVTTIVIGHGHWDHAGQLSSFPNAVLYVQKEELKQIDFFLDYPVDFNGGHIRAVNTLDPIHGAQHGPPAQARRRTPVCGYLPRGIQEILCKTPDGRGNIIHGG